MKKAFQVISVISLCLFVVSCATTPPPMLGEPVVKHRTYEINYDEIWKAVIQSLTAEGEFINVAQKDSGIICFQKSIPVNKLEDVALAPKGFQWSNAFANVSLTVINQKENITRITVNTKIWAKGKNTGQILWYGINAPVHEVEMASKGEIEEDYLNKISNIVSGGDKYEWLEEGSIDD